MTVLGIVDSLVSFYSTLIIVYVVMSWFRPTGAFYDIYRVLGQLCEPYIGVFRRIVPPVGSIDFSPFVALLTLEYLIRPILVRLVLQVS
ncbi:MAG: YggT family protein [Anaerosomatales bacterium]|nr:YggT family protein [Anaerosomatales bacterium]